MSNFWADHWWLLIPLGAFTIPLAGIAMGAFATWQHYSSRNRALEALKVYAQQGKEPPPELLRAVGGERDWKWEWQQRWADEVRDAPADAATGPRRAGRWSDPEAIRARTEYSTARATARAARPTKSSTTSPTATRSSCRTCTSRRRVFRLETEDRGDRRLRLPPDRHLRERFVAARRHPATRCARPGRPGAAANRS